MIGQILTFSRRQPVQRKVQPLQPIVEEALELLHATLPAQVILHSRLAEPMVHALVDSIQIEQVIINLCTNAWQAIADRGGRIEIGLQPVDLESAQALTLGLTRGRHVQIWITDDGAGMDEATMRRAFDPFFTTKPKGAGTGLGLSIVHGIVKAHDGAVALQSKPGEGSRFDLYLPVAEADTREAAPTVPAEEPRRGERVLYLDDDEIMPLMVEQLLGRAGYLIDCYGDALQAVEAVRARPDSFDVVVTDFNMPGMSGLEVVEALAGIRAALPTVLTSGYVSDAMRTRASQLGVNEVLEKQYMLEELGPAIGRALGRQRLQ